jgi:amino acid adenylation domain-containing protein
MTVSAGNLPHFTLLHEGVVFHARQNANRVAIDDGQRTVTYGQLGAAMDNLAGVLCSDSVARNSRVGLYLENSIPAYIGMLGALRAGCCYVPLPPSFPPERIATVIEDADLAAVVTVGEHLQKLLDALPLLQGKTIPSLFVLDRELSVLREAAYSPQLCRTFVSVRGQESLQATGVPAFPRIVEEDLAYMIYTSGTTGKPKGVMVSHKNAMSFLRWSVEYFRLGPDDRLSNHASIAFDISLFDIFGAFLAGAAVCPVIAMADRAYPATFIKERRITVWFSVPNILSMMRAAKHLAPGAFSPHLRLAMFAGEALTPENVAAWRASQPDVPIVNLYGPTEATISCTYHNVGVDSPFSPEAPVAIGRPTPDSEILILKQDADELAADREIGRLFVCGSQVSPGYWRQPELTAKAFRINPWKKDLAARMYETGDLAYRDEQGIIYYVGRADSQVKYLGYRIELGDIEAALRRNPCVDEAAVVLLDDESPILVGAVAVNREEDAMEEAILNQCASLLPSYMVPQRLIFFPSLPQNVNGKIDRKAIKALVIKQMK